MSHFYQSCTRQSGCGEMTSRRSKLQDNRIDDTINCNPTFTLEGSIGLATLCWNQARVERYDQKRERLDKQGTCESWINESVFEKRVRHAHELNIEGLQNLRINAALRVFRQTMRRWSRFPITATTCRTTPRMRRDLWCAGFEQQKRIERSHVSMREGRILKGPDIAQAGNP